MITQTLPEVPTAVANSPWGPVAVVVVGAIIVILTVADRIGSKMPSILAGFRRVATEKDDAVVTELKKDIEELRNGRNADRIERVHLTEDIAQLRSQIQVFQSHLDDLKMKLSLEQEQRRVSEMRAERWAKWHREDLTPNWHVYRQHNEAPNGPFPT